MRFRNHQNLTLELYQALFYEKKRCFDIEVPHDETIQAHFGQNDKLSFSIEPNIFNVVFNDLFLAHEETSQQIEINCLFSFYFAHDIYKVNISKGSHFRTTIENGFLGIYFRRACKSARTTKNVWALAALSGLSERMVSQYIHAVMVINVQKFADLLRGSDCWAYSLAFDAARNHGTSSMMSTFVSF